VSSCNVTWFAIALAEIRTGRILREKADSKQSGNIGDVARKADSSWRSVHVICIFTALLEQGLCCGEQGGNFGIVLCGEQWSSF